MPHCRRALGRVDRRCPWDARGRRWPSEKATEKRRGSSQSASLARRERKGKRRELEPRGILEKIFFSFFSRFFSPPGGLCGCYIPPLIPSLWSWQRSGGLATLGAPARQTSLAEARVASAAFRACVQPSCGLQLCCFPLPHTHPCPYPLHVLASASLFWPCSPASQPRTPAYGRARARCSQGCSREWCVADATLCTSAGRQRRKRGFPLPWCFPAFFSFFFSPSPPPGVVGTCAGCKCGWRSGW